MMSDHYYYIEKETNRPDGSIDKKFIAAYMSRVAAIIDARCLFNPKYGNGKMRVIEIKVDADTEYVETVIWESKVGTN